MKQPSMLQPHTTTLATTAASNETIECALIICYLQNIDSMPRCKVMLMWEARSLAHSKVVIIAIIIVLQVILFKIYIIYHGVEQA